MTGDGFMTTCQQHESCCVMLHDTAGQTGTCMCPLFHEFRDLGEIAKITGHKYLKSHAIFSNTLLLTKD